MADERTSPQKEAMIAGQLYDAGDPLLVEERARAREIVHAFNQSAPGDGALRDELLSKLLGKRGERAKIEPPFHCDYGYNISVGERFYANFGCIILDVVPVTIGEGAFFGPNVQLLAATHPIDPEERARGLELGAPISIGDRVWLGGGVIVCPGVTIGSGTTIGAGSVVTRDIPAGVVAVGNPCRVVRTL